MIIHNTCFRSKWKCHFALDARRNWSKLIEYSHDTFCRRRSPGTQKKTMLHSNRSHDVRSAMDFIDVHSSVFCCSRFGESVSEPQLLIRKINVFIATCVCLSGTNRTDRNTLMNTAFRTFIAVSRVRSCKTFPLHTVFEQNDYVRIAGGFIHECRKDSMKSHWHQLYLLSWAEALLIDRL